MPASRARRTACVRSATYSLLKIFETWLRTVFRFRPRRVAIAGFAWPCTISARISRSGSVTSGRGMLGAAGRSTALQGVRDRASSGDVRYYSARRLSDDRPYAGQARFRHAHKPVAAMDYHIGLLRSDVHRQPELSHSGSWSLPLAGGGAGRQDARPEPGHIPWVGPGIRLWCTPFPEQRKAWPAV